MKSTSLKSRRASSSQSPKRPSPSSNNPTKPSSLKFTTGKARSVSPPITPGSQPRASGVSYRRSAGSLAPMTSRSSPSPPRQSAPNVRRPRSPVPARRMNSAPAPNMKLTRNNLPPPGSPKRPLSPNRVGSGTPSSRTPKLDWVRRVSTSKQPGGSIPAPELPLTSSPVAPSKRAVRGAAVSPTRNPTLISTSNRERSPVGKPRSGRRIVVDAMEIKTPPTRKKSAGKGNPLVPTSRVGGPGQNRGPVPANARPAAGPRRRSPPPPAGRSRAPGRGRGAYPAAGRSAGPGGRGSNTVPRGRVRRRMPPGRGRGPAPPRGGRYIVRGGRRIPVPGRVPYHVPHTARMGAAPPKLVTKPIPDPEPEPKKKSFPKARMKGVEGAGALNFPSISEISDRRQDDETAFDDINKPDGSVRILICSANLGNAKPDDFSLNEWVPSDGFIDYAILHPPRYPVCLSSPTEEHSSDVQLEETSNLQSIEEQDVEQASNLMADNDRGDELVENSEDTIDSGDKVGDPVPTTEEGGVKEEIDVSATDTDDKKNESYAPQSSTAPSSDEMANDPLPATEEDETGGETVQDHPNSGEMANDLPATEEDGTGDETVEEHPNSVEKAINPLPTTGENSMGSEVEPNFSGGWRNAFEREAVMDTSKETELQHQDESSGTPCAKTHDGEMEEPNDETSSTPNQPTPDVQATADSNDALEGTEAGDFGAFSNESWQNSGEDWNVGEGWDEWNADEGWEDDWHQSDAFEDVDWTYDEPNAEQQTSSGHFEIIVIGMQEATFEVKKDKGKKKDERIEDDELSLLSQKTEDDFSQKTGDISESSDYSMNDDDEVNALEDDPLEKSQRYDDLAPTSPKLSPVSPKKSSLRKLVSRSPQRDDSSQKSSRSIRDLSPVRTLSSSFHSLHVGSSKSLQQSSQKSSGGLSPSVSNRSLASDLSDAFANSDPFASPDPEEKPRYNPDAHKSDGFLDVTPDDDDDDDDGDNGDGGQPKTIRVRRRKNDGEKKKAPRRTKSLEGFLHAAKKAGKQTVKAGKKTVKAGKKTLKAGKKTAIAAHQLISEKDHTNREPPTAQQMNRPTEEDEGMLEWEDTDVLHFMFDDQLPSYERALSYQLGQMRMMVYYLKSSVDVNVLSVNTKATGKHNLANKGGIVTEVAVNGTTRLSFSSAHLEAHEGEKKFNARCLSFRRILRGTLPSPQPYSIDASLASHFSFFMGDLNFRTKLPEIEGGSPEHIQASHDLVAKQDWGTLNQHDELSRALSEKKCLVGWKTPYCNFDPTFKVARKDGYSYNPKRSPSYTDRILYRTMDGLDEALRVSLYEPIGTFKSSDHKPIRGAFEIQLNEKLELLPSSESPSTSETLHMLITSIECQIDEQEYKRHIQSTKNEKKKKKDKDGDKNAEANDDEDDDAGKIDPPNPFVLFVSTPPEALELDLSKKKKSWKRFGLKKSRKSKEQKKKENGNNNPFASQWPGTKVLQSSFEPEWSEEVHFEVRTQSKDGSAIDLSGSLLHLSVLNDRRGNDPKLLGTFPLNLAALIKMAQKAKTDDSDDSLDAGSRHHRAMSKAEKNEKKKWGRNLLPLSASLRSSTRGSLIREPSKIIMSLLESADESCEDNQDSERLKKIKITTLEIDEPLIQGGTETGQIKCVVDAWWMENENEEDEDDDYIPEVV